MQALATFALILALSALVALPSVLAIVRKHPHWLAITAVDILLGWTVVGWMVALAWTLRPATARRPRVRKVAKARASSRGHARPAASHDPANDNRSVATVSASLLADPAPLDGDVYEEWLETGCALSERSVRSESTPPKKPAEQDGATTIVARTRSAGKAAA